jgi:serine/threonine protein kinase
MDSKANIDHILEKKFFGKYKPMKKIGEGSFGMIFIANNILTGEQYALKFEDKNNSQNLLEAEAYVMGYLKGCKYFILKISWDSFSEIFRLFGRPQHPSNGITW